MVYTRMKELGQQREYWSVLLGRLVFCVVVVALLLWQRLGNCMVFLSLALMTAASIVHAFYIKIPMYKVADMFDDPDFTRLFHERPEEIRDKEVADPDLLDDDQITETDIDAAYDFFLHGAYMNFLFPRLLYLLFSVVCLYGIWNSIWGGDLLPFGLPCPAFLRFLLTAPVSMIPLAILLVGEGVSLWIVPLLPDKEKPASR